MNRHILSVFTIASALAINAAPAGAALIGHWTFDDADPIGDLTFDGAGSNNGTTGGMNNMAAAPVSRIGAGAANFGTAGNSQGYFDFVNAGDFSVTNANSGLAMAFWYKAPAGMATAEGTNRLPVHLLGSGIGGTSVAVELSAGTARAFVRQANNANVRATGTTDIFDDTWHHVVITYASATGTAAVYIDGQLDATATNAGVGAAFTFNKGRIGSHAENAALDIGGLMDDVGIWNHALSDQEIALIHGLGHFAGINLADDGIAAVLAAFNSQGQAEAGGYQWAYATGLTGGIGTVGGSIADSNAYIVLDGSGAGVQIVVPEPGSALLGGGMLLALGRRGGRRRKQD